MATTANVRSLSQATPSGVVDSLPEVKQKELHSNRQIVQVDFERFFGIEPARLDRTFDSTISDSTYLPKVDSPHADWVVTAALNAFRAYQSGGFTHVHRFATVGTGSGTDAIAALDTFSELSGLAMTDMHEEVVMTAKANVLSATIKARHPIRSLAERAVAKAGDLLLPLEGEEPFDLIYENLPNIPLTDPTLDLRDGQTSSTYVGDRSCDNVPRSITAALLELHYVCLVQAKSFGLLSSTGAILSSIGGRIPMKTILEVADLAGYSGRILTLWWKEQSEPDSVIAGYAEYEEKGLGPFYFYPTLALEKAFRDRTPAGAALHASQVLEELMPDRLSAVEALQKHREGFKMGHTVVVMASVLTSAKAGRFGEDFWVILAVKTLWPTFRAGEHIIRDY